MERLCLEHVYCNQLITICRTIGKYGWNKTEENAAQVNERCHHPDNLKHYHLLQYKMTIILLDNVERIILVLRFWSLNMVHRGKNRWNTFLRMKNGTNIHNPNFGIIESHDPERNRG